MKIEFSKKLMGFPEPHDQNSDFLNKNTIKSTSWGGPNRMKGLGTF